jgi:hypothetical protein
VKQIVNEMSRRGKPEMALLSFQRWLAQNWGNVASVVGLGVGVWVLTVSHGARKAALEAKRISEQRSLANDLRVLAEDVKYLSGFCDESRWDLAGHIAVRLAQDLALRKARWNHRLDVGSRRSLNSVLAQLGTAATQLRKFRSAPPSDPDKQSLVEAVGRVGVALSTEVGRYESLPNIERE